MIILSSIIGFDKVVMVGDFNIHVDDSFSSFAADFINATEFFNFIQHVSGPMHVKDHTLDLVFSLSLKVHSVCSEGLCVSYHVCVLFNLSFKVDSKPTKCLRCSQSALSRDVFCSF